MEWKIIHREVSSSTNVDARSGSPGDVFTADFQTAGRGRLDHQWSSERGKNLLMSAVVAVNQASATEVATVPLVAGIAVVRALTPLLAEVGLQAKLKWPNDILVAGRKVAGILCERHDERVIVGLGLNVKQCWFADDLAVRATSLALLGIAEELEDVRTCVLASLATAIDEWRQQGFTAFLPEIHHYDFLRGREVCVQQTDADRQPFCGYCAGVAADGALIVDGRLLYAGEVHVRVHSGDRTDGCDFLK